ncbi:serine/threonine-protein kinase [Streptomyces sp. NPDC058646]|uniref:serine/threonine-protein kinase n=1 Tax=Streptomyces sp. NPDC058646 TaxID=3346574 RepID=UPI003653F679
MGVPMEGMVLAGRYELAELIGVGGMGEVWRGRDLSLARDVAVKVIARPGEDKLALRLRAEARAAARLSDPHVVAVHDVGEGPVDGQTVVFLVMELVDGRPLGTQSGPSAVEDVVRWGVQICAGLQAAHAAGIVHRDIKPGNILLTARGRIKICDFGIARQSGVRGLTTTGSVIGTPAYMAPEQAQGRHDARTDLYALGCVLYELLTGEPPFTGSGWDVLAQHANRVPVPVRTHRPEVAGELDRLVLRLLSKDPADRPPSAAATGELLSLAGKQQGYRTTELWEPSGSLMAARDLAARPTETATARPAAAQPVPPPAEQASARVSRGASASRDPEKPKKALRSTGAAWIAFVAPAVAVGGQLVAFQVLSGTWSVILGIVIGSVFSVDRSISEEGDQDGLSLMGLLLAMLVAAAATIVLLRAPGVPWWVGILALMLTTPVLFWVSMCLVRVFTAVARARESVFVANGSGMAAGVTAGSLLLARTDLGVLVPVLGGLLIWAVVGLAVTFLLPPDRS